MPHQDITFGSFSDARPLTCQQRVYVRAAWADAWTHIPDAWADVVRWTLSPSIPTAQIYWKFGSRQKDGGAFSTVAKLTWAKRLYVKIEIDVTDNSGEDPEVFTRKWYGTIEFEERAEKGKLGMVEFGEQVFTAYGMELALFKWTIISSWSGSATNSVEFHRTAFDFNADGTPNRSATQVAVGTNPTTSYLFDPVFGNNYWSSREIVRYLLTLFMPRDPFDVTIVPFNFVATDLDLLEDSDKPTIQVHGRTVGESLSQILNRSRLYSWYVDSEIVDSNEAFRIRIVPLNDGSIPTIPANTNTIALEIDQARDVGIAVGENSLEVVDRVIVQGAKRRICCSMHFPESLGPLGQGLKLLSPGWSEVEEEEYWRAGLGKPGYPIDEEIDERRKFNHLIRTSSPYYRVYSRYKLSNNFEPLTPHPLSGESIRILPSNIRFLPTLPILEGWDYSNPSAPVQVSQSHRETYRLPHTIVAIDKRISPSATTKHYAYLHSLGMDDIAIGHDDDDEFHIFSGSTTVVAGGKEIQIKIYGAPQHVLGKDNPFIYSPQWAQQYRLEEDVDDIQPVVDWRQSILTVAIEDDAYCSVEWPPATPGIEITRELYIDAGSAFKLDSIIKDTIVNVQSGKLIRAANTAFIRDDRAALFAVAYLAFDWRSKFRAAAVINGIYEVPFQTIQIGQLVTEYDTKPLNSIVSEISIQFSRVVAEVMPQVDATRIEIKTEFGELDYMQAVAT